MKEFLLWILGLWLGFGACFIIVTLFLLRRTNKTFPRTNTTIRNVRVDGDGTYVSWVENDQLLSAYNLLYETDTGTKTLYRILKESEG